MPVPLAAVTWGLVPEARLAAAGAGLLVRRAADLAPLLAGDAALPVRARS